MKYPRLCNPKSVGYWYTHWTCQPLNARKGSITHPQKLTTVEHCPKKESERRRPGNVGPVLVDTRRAMRGHSAVDRRPVGGVRVGLPAGDAVVGCHKFADGLIGRIISSRVKVATRPVLARRLSCKVGGCSCGCDGHGEMNWSVVALRSSKSSEFGLTRRRDTRQ
jgi:hypothetical protein